QRRARGRALGHRQSGRAHPRVLHCHDRRPEPSRSPRTCGKLKGVGTTLLQIDAFTEQPFAGNPAAVCLLPSARDAAWMQHVANEMSLAETAFVVPRAGDDGFDLRWFTPTTEVDLCGHATLASAHALWLTGELAADATARFHTKSGVLTAQRDGDWIELNFP